MSDGSSNGRPTVVKQASLMQRMFGSSKSPSSSASSGNASSRQAANESPQFVGEQRSEKSSSIPIPDNDSSSVNSDPPSYTSGSAKQSGATSSPGIVHDRSNTNTGGAFGRSNTSSTFNDEFLDERPTMMGDFDFEYEDDGGSLKDNSEAGSVVSDMGYQSGNISFSAPSGGMYYGGQSLPTVPSQASSASQSQPKRRSSYFSFGGSSSSGSSSSIQKDQAAAAAAAAAAATAANAAPPHITDPALKVFCTTLSALGKQIKLVEQECKREDEIQTKHWKDAIKPQLETTIAEYEKKVQILKTRMEKEVNRGAEYLNKLEEELLQISDKLDEMKRSLYFPFASITLGNSGVYLAMDDFWIEYVFGGYELDLIPDKIAPRIKIKLAGTTSKKSTTQSSTSMNDDIAGVAAAAAVGATTAAAAEASQYDAVNARLQIEKFQVAGDRGKGVPKLKFDLIKITIAFHVDITLQYDMKTSKWITDPKSFRISILSFRGPYGLNKSIISLILSLMTPSIRKMVMQHLPYELGLLIRTFPSPYTMRGEFDIRGVDLNLMHTEWYKSRLLSKLTNYSITQLEMFYWMQKALDRTGTQLLKTSGELMNYIKFHSKNPGIWIQLMNLWSQATILYCEKVTLAKNDGQYAEQRYDEITQQDTLSLPQYTIHFEDFLETCEGLTQKRISMKLDLLYVDGQLSINHLLSFLFQIVYRIANDMATNANTVKKVQLQNLIEQIKQRYDDAVLGLQIVSKNMDFAQLAIHLHMHSGSNGYLTVAVRDILAQAPLLLKLNIMTDKNMGAIPLVPYIVSFKPQENGDICLELYHFTHDTAQLPNLIENIQSHTQEFLQQATVSGMIQAGTGGAVNETNTTNSPNNSHGHSQARRGSSMVKSHRDLVDANTAERLKEKSALNYTNYDNSIRTGCYSTSYNKVVDNITSGKTIPRSFGCLEAYRASTNTNNMMITGNIRGSMYAPPTSYQMQALEVSSVTGSDPGGNNTTGQGQKQELDKSIRHLMVKQDELKKSLESVLNDHPQGDTADTMLSVLAVSPHISMIVDQPTTLKPGSELFTVLLGHPKQDWKPFGTQNRLEDEGDIFDQFNRGRASMIATGSSPSAALLGGGQASSYGSGGGFDGLTGIPGLNSGGSQGDNGSSTSEQMTIGGVPIRVQTAPGIKLLIQVPKADVMVNLPSLLRFLLAHFADLLLLKSYLQILVGGDFAEEHLLAVKMIMEKACKYLLLPGMDLTLNLNGKVVAMNGEIMVRLETPMDDIETNQTSLNTSKSAVVFNAQLSLKELFEDSRDIESIMKVAMNGDLTEGLPRPPPTK